MMISGNYKRVDKLLIQCRRGRLRKWNVCYCSYTQLTTAVGVIYRFRCSLTFIDWLLMDTEVNRLGGKMIFENGTMYFLTKSNSWNYLKYTVYYNLYLINLFSLYVERSTTLIDCEIIKKKIYIRLILCCGCKNCNYNTIHFTNYKIYQKYDTGVP